MVNESLLVLLFLVRAAGLAIVVAIASIFGFMFVFSEKANGPMAAGCAFVVLSSVLSWPRLPNAWRRDPPTKRQLAYAAKLGIEVGAGMTKGRLSDLIDSYQNSR